MNIKLDKPIFSSSYDIKKCLSSMEINDHRVDIKANLNDT